MKIFAPWLGARRTEAVMRMWWMIIGIGVMGLGAAKQAQADCHHAHKSFPEKSTFCQNGSVFMCGEFGAWHKTTGSCEAKRGPTPPVPLQSSKDETSKEKPPAGSTTPTG